MSGCAIGSGNAILGSGTSKPGKKALNCVSCGLLRLQLHPFNAMFCNNTSEATYVQDGSKVTWHGLSGVKQSVMWLLHHSPCLSVCDDTDCTWGTQIAAVTIFGYQIIMNNWVLMFVYYTGGVIHSFFLSYSDLFLHTLARCSGYCYTWLHSMTNTYTHSVGFLWTSDKPIAVTSTWRHNTHNRQTSMAPAGFEPAIPASERPHTHTLDRADPVVSILYTSLEFRCILFQLMHKVNLKKNAHSKFCLVSIFTE
jgi:hypothetical protein